MLLSIVSSAMAQETNDEQTTSRWQFRPIVAANLSRPIDAPDDVSVVKRLGYEAGVELSYDMSPWLSASFGTLFAYDRYREDLTGDFVPATNMGLSRKPELRSMYIVKVPLLINFHITKELTFKTGAEPWFITNAVMYPGNAVPVDRFQVTVPTAVSYSFGYMEVGAKYTIGTEKIAGCKPNSLALYVTVPIRL